MALLETFKNKKSIALLLDPDKLDTYTLEHRINGIKKGCVDYVFVGGSLISSDKTDWVIKKLKESIDLPIILFPGHTHHINENADAILFLSLISGRNPDFLIGQHVIAAPILKRSKLEILPTGYILVDGGKPTTVSYISNTTPIPSDKADVALATALAGSFLGLKLIYLDAGSGALNAVPSEMIQRVSSGLEIPLIVGGGIRTTEKVLEAWEAGAHVVVIGNAVEANPSFLDELLTLKATA